MLALYTKYVQYKCIQFTLHNRARVPTTSNGDNVLMHDSHLVHTCTEEWQSIALAVNVIYYF